MVMTTAGVTRGETRSQRESKKKQNGYEMGSKKNTDLVPIIKIILFFFNVEQKKKAKSTPRAPAVVLWS